MQAVTEHTVPLLAFRSDAVVRIEGCATEQRFIIQNPDTGRIIRLGAVEHFIVRQLDGSTSLEQLRQRVLVRFDANMDCNELATFVMSLKSRGLLQSDGNPEQRESRLAGSVLYLRLKAYDPDRHLTRLARLLRFCFTPGFVYVAGLVIALAIVVLLSNLDEIVRDTSELFTFSTLIAAWFIVIGTTITHEYAHGLTCKHFGGRVREMGVMLIFFQPALYCNVSDAWLFDEKYKRIWVTAAGGFIDLLIWALAIVAWRICAPETVLHYVATIIAATATLRTAFNLNPLIKLDGYYLLSDWLELPNLRQRAGAYLRTRLTFDRARSRDAKAMLTQRDRWIYVIYGFLAFVFSTWLLTFIASRIGGYLTDQLQGIGFVLFMGLVTVGLWPVLRRVAERKSVAEFRHDTTGAINSGPVWLVLFVSAGAAMAVVETEATVSGEFKIHPSHNADVRAQVEGIIQDIIVKEGDSVSKGQVIVRLATFDKQAELGRIEADIRQTRADLKALIRGATQENMAVAHQTVITAQTNLEHSRRLLEQAGNIRADRINRARSSVAKAKDRLRFARKATSRQEKLIKKKYSSEKTYDVSLEAVAVGIRALEETKADLRMSLTANLAEERQAMAIAERQVIDAQAKLDVFVAGNSKEQIDAKKARLERLLLDRAYVETQIELLTVRSPIDGVVTTPRPTEKIGQLATKGQLILEVYDVRIVTADVYVSEKDIGDVKLGQAVILKARAYAHTHFTGTVAAIASTAQGHDDGLRGNVVRISTFVVNSDLALKPGMSGHGKVKLGKQRLYQIATHRLIRFIKVEFWSWW